MIPDQTDVLIVGAGPTGLALALALQQAGVAHVLVDRLAEGQNTSRAAALHAHTLEELEPLGVTEALVARGRAVRQFALRDRDRRLIGLDFAQLPSRHAYLLMLPQDETERVLADRLAVLGGQVHRGVAATAIMRQADGAEVTLDTPQGPARIAARYVVGADGMRSLVREAMGTDFDGASYEDSFILADVEMDWPIAEEVSLFFSAQGLLVVAPLPNGAFRVVATLAEAPEQPSVADVQALVAARGPRGATARVRRVLWGSRFRLHHRVARTYREGPLLLIGDAAHVHSPAGGQGMNTGLVDAVLLGRLLADVVQGRRGEAALDAYGAQRRPAAAKVLRLAGLLTGAAVLRNRALRLLRNAAMTVIGRVPAARRQLMLNLSGLNRRDLARLPLA